MPIAGGASGNLVMLFDTQCVLCSSAVRFALRHEQTAGLTFIGAWSKTGLLIAKRFDISPTDLDETFLIIDGATAHQSSDALLIYLDQLKAPWRWARAIKVLPKPLRDWGYQLIARNRYRIFGRADQCLTVTPEVADRFPDVSDTRLKNLQPDD